MGASISNNQSCSSLYGIQGRGEAARQDVGAHVGVDCLGDVCSARFDRCFSVKGLFIESSKDVIPFRVMSAEALINIECGGRPLGPFSIRTGTMNFRNSEL